MTNATSTPDEIPFNEAITPAEGLKLLESLTGNDQTTIAARYEMISRIDSLGEGWTAQFKKTQTIAEKARGETPKKIVFQLLKDGEIEFTAAVDNMKGTRSELAKALREAQEVMRQEAEQSTMPKQEGD